MSANTSTNFLAENTNIGFTPTVSALTILGGIIVIAVLCVGVIFAVKYYRLHESPWWSDRAKTSGGIWDWISSFQSSPSLDINGKLREVPSGFQLSAPPAVAAEAPPQASSPSPPPVAWCFVGEDLTGRYCVKVPSAASCDRTRVFNSQQDCELQSANALPAGVVSPHDGRKMTPLSSGILAP